MTINNSVLEDFLLPDSNTIEELNLFDEDETLLEMNDNIIYEDHQFEEGLNNENPENISRWMEEASQKFYAG